jgi:serine/threonine protein kinase/formylglycine-generating enzyme required for sulfatase activity
VPNASRVQAVFQAALEVADSTAQAQFLDRECGDDADLRQQVESLLKANRNLAPLWRGGPPLDPDSTHRMSAGDESEETDLSFLSPPTKPDTLGRLGHYEIQSVLGRGGFGIVFKAFDEVLHRVVAIKMMSATIAATSPARKRFLREARAAAAVRHENVVQVYGVEESPIPYLVMEFVPGKTLQQILDESGPLEAKDLLRIGADVARGLAAAHEKGLIHRDIKPGNILVEPGPDARAKLTDFGLARAADDASLTQSGIVAGTPMYMAPEQARGEEMDHRADLFSLGSVLYVAASGRPPFRAATSMAVLQRVAEESARPIREIIPEVPKWLCDVIARLHEKDPAKRFRSAREVADLLTDCQTQLQRHGKLVDRSRIPGPGRPRRAKPEGRRSWLVPATAMGLFMTVTVTEATGLTKLFSGLYRVSAAGTPTPAARPAGPATPRFTNGLGMEFVRVPKGKAWLGGGEGKPGDREVAVEQDFYLGVYEVTQGEWERVLGKDRNLSRYTRTGANAADVAGLSDADIKRLPIDSVSWDDCQEFVRKLNEQVDEPGWTYRLPTSDEWEYACRGGPGQPWEQYGYDFYLDRATIDFPRGKVNLKDGGPDKPVKVGSYPPNRLGLYDMHGNVFEYCDEVTSGGDDNNLRILRGGFWNDGSEFGRARNSGAIAPANRYTGGGLRLARVPR